MASSPFQRSRFVVTTEPEPAHLGRSRQRHVAPHAMPVLGGVFPVVLRSVSPLGTAVAVAGRPPTVLADPRFEPAHRIPLSRFTGRFTVAADGEPDPTGFFVLGFLESECDAEVAIRTDPVEFQALPWIPGDEVHEYLAEQTRRFLRQLPFPMNDRTAQVAGRLPLADTQRFRVASEEVEEVLLRSDSRVVLLHGASGVGKSMFLSYFAQRLRKGLVSGPLQGFSLVTIDPSVFDGGRQPDADAARNVALQQLSEKDVILSVDEAHRLFRSSSGRDDSVDLLKLLTSEFGLRLILSTNETSRMVGDEAWNRRQSLVHLPEATAEEVLEHILPARARGAARRGVEADAEALREVVACSSLTSDHAQPHAAVALFEQAVAHTLRWGGARVSSAVVRDLARKAQGRVESDVEACSTALRERVVGHDEEVGQLARWYVADQRRRLRLRGQPEPRPFAVIAVGPSGVGKTEMTRALHRVMGGATSAEPFSIRGGDFASEHNVARLVGAPPSYVGYGRGGELIRWIKKNRGRGVVELAEPERGCVQLIERVVLPLLDGSLTSNEGDTVLTRGLCLAITSNVGVNRRGIGFAANERRRAIDDVMQELGRLLPRPVLSRCSGRVLPLRPLRAEDLREIVRRWCRDLADREGLVLDVSEAVVTDLVDRTGGLDQLGARALRFAFDDRIAGPIEELLVSASLPRGLRLVVDAEGDIACEVAS